MIVGERVRLRALRPEDVDTFQRWHENHEFTVLDGRIYPPSPTATEAWLRSKSLPSFADATFGIEDEGGHLIGYTSLRRTAAEDRSAEFGIALGPSHWSQGYGTDATRTMLRFAFTEMNLHRVMLRVADYNPRAQRVYEKCGFQVEGRLREARYYNGEWRDKIVMGILSREFLNLQQYEVRVLIDESANRIAPTEAASRRDPP